LAQLAGTRGFDVTAGEILTVNLVCDATVASSIYDSALTAIFVAGTYGPSGTRWVAMTPSWWGWDPGALSRTRGGSTPVW
jgi:hypothetical protein